MRLPIPWPWLILALLLLLPGPAGRFLLDLLGGLTLTLLLLPLLAGGAGLIAWWVLRQRLRTCETCGAVNLGSPICASCGAPLDPASNTSGWARTAVEVDPRDVTITVEAVDVRDHLSSSTAANGSADSPSL